MPFCYIVSWRVVHRCLYRERCLSTTHTLTYPVSVLVDIVQSCAIHGNNDMSNGIVCCLCVILPLSNITSLHGVYLAPVIRDESCSGVCEGIDIQGLECGPVGLTHRVWYTEKNVNVVGTAPRTRQYRKI